MGVPVRLPSDEQKYANDPLVHDTMRYLLFTPHKNGKDMKATIEIPFHIALMGLNLFFPLDLYAAENQELLKSYQESINIQRAYQAWTRREIAWSGDRWTLAGWGPPVCKNCGFPTFVTNCERSLPEIASMCRSKSNYVPTFAPSTYFHSETGTQHCIFSSYEAACSSTLSYDEEEESHSYGNLVVKLSVERPHDYMIDSEYVNQDTNIFYTMARFLENKKHMDYKTSTKKRRYSTAHVTTSTTVV